MKRFLTIAALAASVIVFCSARPKAPVNRVVYQTTIHCENCGKKVTENLSFEKGVRDLKVDVPGKTVTIDYSPAKTDTVALARAISKLGYKARVIEHKSL